MHFSGKKLRLRRIERDVSAADLARACGVSPQAVNAWESGEARGPGSLDRLSCVALHLKCKIADICDDVPDEWIGPTLARRPSEEDVQIYRDMARRLRIVREAIGMSVEQFSVRYGVAPDRWADVEENTILPNVSVLKRLCLDYDVTLDFLVFGIFRQNPPPLMAKIRQTHPELVGEDPADHVIPRSLISSAVSMAVSSIAALSISSTFLLPTLV